MNTDENQDTTDDSWRDDPEWHGDQFPAWNSDKSALRAARTEARESLEETITFIQQINESAMKTLRIDLVIIGLSLTAVSSFQSTSRLVNVFTIFGFVAVSVSTVVAVVAIIGSEYPTGVSESYIEDFQRASWSEHEWNEWMLREYCLWLSEANEMADGDAQALLYTQILLGVGILLLITGVVLGIVGFIHPVEGIQQVSYA